MFKWIQNLFNYFKKPSTSHVTWKTGHPVGMAWDQAYKHAKAGHKIHRVGWKNPMKYVDYKDGTFWCHDAGVSVVYSLSAEDQIGMDWERTYI